MGEKLKRLPARFYRSNSGREPVREWLLGLTPHDRKIIGTDIKDVEFSWPIAKPLIDPLGHGLWEVPSQLPRSRIVRVILCVAGGQMVLLHGFIKKTQKTPPRDIELALRRKKGSRAVKAKNIGSSFDDLLREDGTYEEVTAAAVKRVLARQLEAAMAEKHLTKTEMARRMKTSRAALNRLLDPGNEAVTLDTLRRAAAAVGREVRLELV